MPRHMKVGELMATDLVTLTEEETLAHAQRCMTRGRIRHLPVVRDNILVGLITHRDILAASFSILGDVDYRDQRQVFVTVPVIDVMHRDVRDGSTRPPGCRSGAYPTQEQVRLPTGCR